MLARHIEREVPIRLYLPLLDLSFLFLHDAVQGGLRSLAIVSLLLGPKRPNFYVVHKSNKGGHL